MLKKWFRCEEAINFHVHSTPGKKVNKHISDALCTVCLSNTDTHAHTQRERDTHARTSCFYYAVFSRNGKQSSVTSPPTYSLIPSILWGWMMITGKQTETAQKRTPLRQQQRPVHLTLNTASPARSGFNQAKAEHSNNRKSQS